MEGDRPSVKRGDANQFCRKFSFGTLLEYDPPLAARRASSQAVFDESNPPSCVPEKITIDGSAANKAAIESDNAAHGTAIGIRTITYLNTIVEQDHRAVKRVTRPMVGCTSFEAAQGTLAGIELMHMMKKKQWVVEARDKSLTVAEQFYALAS